MHPDTPIDRGLVLHLDAADVRSYPGHGMFWRDLKGNFDGELGGDPTNDRSDPHWTGRGFRFAGHNFIRLLNTQQGFFKTFTKPGARFSIDCCFTTGSRIANPHFLLADGAHGNPLGGSGFSFYFFNFENGNLRLSIQNNGRTALTRAVHVTHPAAVATSRTQRAAVSISDPEGTGYVTLDDDLFEFDGTFVTPTDQDSPYHVHIGAPGNIEYNVGARIEHHPSELDLRIDTFEHRMQIPYGRMRFHPGFEMHAMLVYDRALTIDELEHNRRYLQARFFPGGSRSYVLPAPERDVYGNVRPDAAEPSRAP
ncbi:MAG: hypothetical protein KDC98_20940 [Planctomycetes bacterium]|nr:hypothetical protein [Planctomycetota bacterium]